MLASLRYESGKIPLFFATLLLTLNAKRVWLAWRRRSVKKRAANQHTFHGFPVSEFASWLKKNEGFKLTDAQSQLALSRNQYDKIAADLDLHGITIKGENNARILRPISLEQLVQQLRDKFPLAWDERGQDWTNKEGAFGRHLRDQEYRDRKRIDTVERRERRVAKREEQVEQEIEQASTFTRLMLT